jgi:hypothetical protein
VSFDSVLQESSVEDLVVLDELVVKLSTPLDFGKAEGAWVNGINNLTVDSSGGTLFYFGKLELFIKVEYRFIILTSSSSLTQSRMTPLLTKNAPSIIPIVSPDIF